MKKIYFSTAFFVLFLGTTAFANGEELVSARVRESFKKEFTSAVSVSWKEIKKEKIYEAQFIYNNQRLCAFFDENGELLATSRAIHAESLPLLIIKGLNSKYEDFRLLEVLEHVKGAETSYLLKLDDSNVRVIVQAFPSGSFHLLKKEKIK